MKAGKALTLSDLHKIIPRECFQISTFKSWFAFFRILLLLGLCILLENKIKLAEDNLIWSLPSLLILCFFHGQVLVGLFVLGHDCGHRSFSRNQKLNLLMGYVCFSPLATGWVKWNQTHNHHHAHTQLKGQDVDWSSYLMTAEEEAESTWKRDFARKAGRALPFGVFFWIWLNAVKRGISNSTREARISNLIMWSVMLAIYSSLWAFLGPLAMLKHHAVPATVSMITGYFLLTIQHANEQTKWFDDKSWTPFKGQMDSTFDVRFPRFLEWLWLDINIHIPHHVAPGIPWYHLRKAGKALKSSHPDIYQERFFGPKEISWMIRTPLIEYSAEKEAFKLALMS
jgi:acyl-lipid omega-6 desaturase (Delta-12 desaturase)